jgi:sec-independent protein translocase protein TatC
MSEEPATEQGPEDDKMMSLWEHLDELRMRLTRAAAAYIAAMFAAWAVKDPILAWLWKPFVDSWKAEKLAGEPKLHFAAPGDAFLAYFKLSMIAGLGLAAPVIFYQVWSFIAPGLYRKERSYAIGFVMLSSLFFVGGGLFGWRMAFPISFQYFLGLTADAGKAGITLEPTVMVGDYLDFVAQMLLAFGVIFELPLLLTFLSMIGLVNYLQLFRFGRWFVMIAAIVGAVLSPPDTTSMIVMTIPLIVLYFLSIGLAYLFGQKPSEAELLRFHEERAAKKQDAEKRRQQRAEQERLDRELEKAERTREQEEKQARRDQARDDKQK